MSEDEKYLTGHHWIDHGGGGLEWIDPLSPFRPIPVPTAHAVAFQRARDAAEERKAWDMYAAAGLSVQDARVTVDQIARVAGEMLDQRRHRFGKPDCICPTCGRARELAPQALQANDSGQG
jgi:hypothetical protein